MPLQTLGQSDTGAVSPLMLADHLLTLAQHAEQAGLNHTADRLVILAHTVLDEPPNPRFH